MDEVSITDLLCRSVNSKTDVSAVLNLTTARAAGGSIFNVDSTAGLSLTTPVHFITFQLASNGIRVEATVKPWKGVVLDETRIGQVEKRFVGDDINVPSTYKIAVAITDGLLYDLIGGIEGLETRLAAVEAISGAAPRDPITIYLGTTASYPGDQSSQLPLYDPTDEANSGLNWSQIFLDGGTFQMGAYGDFGVYPNSSYKMIAIPTTADPLTFINEVGSDGFNSLDLYDIVKAYDDQGTLTADDLVVQIDGVDHNVYTTPFPVFFSPDVDTRVFVNNLSVPAIGIGV